jgi:hypothetical protein
MGAAIVAFTLVPDLRAYLHKESAPLRYGWDTSNLTASQGFVEIGLVPMKDFFYPYGFQWLYDLQYIIWSKPFFQDGLPYDVRDPLVFSWMIQRYVPLKVSTATDILRRRRPGEAIPAAFWSSELGGGVDLEYMPSGSDAAQSPSCNGVRLRTVRACQRSRARWVDGLPARRRGGTLVSSVVSRPARRRGLPRPSRSVIVPCAGWSDSVGHRRDARLHCDRRRVPLRPESVLTI